MNSLFVNKRNPGRFDRLSSLPESLVIEILSCLGTREAVATCVLSKRWRFVWTNLPRLELEAKEAKLGKFVNRMIAVEWPILRSLSLGKLKISHEELGSLLSRCPVLESLELRKCWGFYCVVVGNPSVRRLCVTNESPKLTFILAPYIRELEVCGIPLRVLHASNLDRATLNIYQVPGPRSFEWIMSGPTLLLRDIDHVGNLSLRGYTADLISRMAFFYRGFQLQLCRLQNLEIFGRLNIHGVIALLRSSPNIHNLLISHFQWDRWTGHKSTLGCDELLHLKFVDIAFIHNVTVKLAQIILEKAPSLEEMVIRSSRNNSWINYFDDFNINQLLHYPRSSQKAKVLLLE